MSSFSDKTLFIYSLFNTYYISSFGYFASNYFLFMIYMSVINAYKYIVNIISDYYIFYNLKSVYTSYSISL